MPGSRRWVVDDVLLNMTGAEEAICAVNFLTGNGAQDKSVGGSRRKQGAVLSIPIRPTHDTRTTFCLPFP